MLVEVSDKYGKSIIKEYSQQLVKEIGKKYNERTLRIIRQFYLFLESYKWPTVSATLNWSIYDEIMKLDDYDSIKYYMVIASRENLSVRQLCEKIKNKEYEKLSNDTKQKLIKNRKPELTELVKNPIVINNLNNIEVIKEKTLQKLIMEDIYSFLKQLGNDYSFVGNEYPVKLENRIYKIDLLLFNMEYEQYVLVELKIGEVKKEDIGQIKFYMNYIDKHKKKPFYNPTAGIILCHKDKQSLTKRNQV